MTKSICTLSTHPIPSHLQCQAHQQGNQEGLHQIAFYFMGTMYEIYMKTVLQLHI